MLLIQAVVSARRTYYCTLPTFEFIGYRGQMRFNTYLNCIIALMDPFLN